MGSTKQSVRNSSVMTTQSIMPGADTTGHAGGSTNRTGKITIKITADMILRAKRAELAAAEHRRRNRIIRRLGRDLARLIEQRNEYQPVRRGQPRAAAPGARFSIKIPRRAGSKGPGWPC